MTNELGGTAGMKLPTEQPYPVVGIAPHVYAMIDPFSPKVFYMNAGFDFSELILLNKDKGVKKSLKWACKILAKQKLHEDQRVLRAFLEGVKMQ